MDLASLITHPGSDLIGSVKSRGLYSPPEHPITYKPGPTSCYFSVPTTYKHSPRPPLSPPAEEQPKFSLPSISTLIESADSAPLPPNKRQRTSTPAQEIDLRIQKQPGEVACLPPTPPLRPGSVFRTTTTSGHSPSGSSRPLECAIAAKSQERPGHVTLPSPADSRSSVSSQGSQGSRQQQQQQQHLPGPYASPAPSVHYSSPIEPSGSSAMYYQRSAPPAPPTTVPAPAPAPASLPPQILPPTWQHHHYFPSSSATAQPYQQTHDRYICRTCHKAFSRPSSLRIHSHSHTGEKPFRCTHAGCGKAFSVRSNMKRHERGCHSARTTSSTTVPAPPPPAAAVV